MGGSHSLRLPWGGDYWNVGLIRETQQRPCGDFRFLNKKTVLDKYPVKYPRSFTGQIHGKTIFSKIDLTKGYHQIQIAKADRLKTAVITPWGLFEFNRLPMGLANSAQAFQRLMDEVT